MGSQGKTVISMHLSSARILASETRRLKKAEVRFRAVVAESVERVQVLQQKIADSFQERIFQGFPEGAGRAWFTKLSKLESGRLEPALIFRHSISL